jgi:hypothetical protein
MAGAVGSASAATPRAPRSTIRIAAVAANSVWLSFPFVGSQLKKSSPAGRRGIEANA